MDNAKKRDRKFIHVPRHVASLVRVVARATGQSVGKTVDHLTTRALRKDLGGTYGFGHDHRDLR